MQVHYVVPKITLEQACVCRDKARELGWEKWALVSIVNDLSTHFTITNEETYYSFRVPLYLPQPFGERKVMSPLTIVTIDVTA